LAMSDTAVAALIEALKDPEVTVRVAAAESLTKTAPKHAGETLVLALNELFANTNLLVRLRAVDCLVRLGVASENLPAAQNDPAGLVRARVQNATHQSVTDPSVSR
jgi:HEAT repeat protein